MLEHGVGLRGGRAQDFVELTVDHQDRDTGHVPHENRSRQQVGHERQPKQGGDQSHHPYCHGQRGGDVGGIGFATGNHRGDDRRSHDRDA